MAFHGQSFHPCDRRFRTQQHARRVEFLFERDRHGSGVRDFIEDIFEVIAAGFGDIEGAAIFLADDEASRFPAGVGFHESIGAEDGQ